MYFLDCNKIIGELEFDLKAAVLVSFSFCLDFDR
jgi:hypothetical protein